MLDTDRKPIRGVSGVYQITCLANDRFYIGSSVNVGNRFSEHLSHLKSNQHHSAHMQRAWNKYGPHQFVFKLLELVEEDRLLEREQWYLDEYRPFDKEIGFNTLELAGRNTGLVMSEKTKEKLRQKALGRRVSEGTKIFLREIWTAAHEERTERSIEERGVEFDIKSPTGEIIHVKGMRQFARDHNLDHSQMRRLLNGEHQEVKGWTLPHVQLPLSQYLVSPSGDRIEIPRNGIKSFSRQYGLNPSMVGRVLRGIQQQYKGWTQYKEPETHESQRKSA